MRQLRLFLAYLLGGERGGGGGGAKVFNMKVAAPSLASAARRCVRQEKS